jgi:NTF2 fold immunity protein
MRRFLAIAVLLTVSGAGVTAHPDERQHSYTPPRGFVPDAETATRIAEAVLIPIYGKESIQNERPFRATLDDGIWTVRGRLPLGAMFGGVALIEISKSDGRILRVTHGK